MRFMIFVLALAVIATPARAQDNEIKIIQPDGSVVVFKLPEPEPAPEPMPVPTPAEVKQQQAEEQGQIPAEAIEADVVEEAPAKEKHDQKAKAPPKPSRKKSPIVTPTKPDESIGRIKTAPELQPIAPGTEITSEMAVSIALEHAPPAGSVSVLKRSIGDRMVYAVTFRTEEGPFDVLVDTNTGEIVKP